MFCILDFIIKQRVMNNRKTDVLTGFKKSIEVINSCENEIHLQGAQKYINNFLVSNSQETEEVINNHSILKVDTFVESAHHRLQVQLKKKREELNNE